MDPASAAAAIYQCAKLLYLAVAGTKANHKQCQRLKMRVQTLEQEIQINVPKWTNDHVPALMQLIQALKSAIDLVEKHGKKHYLIQLLTHNDSSDAFERCHRTLTDCVGDLHLALTMRSDPKEDQQDAEEDRAQLSVILKRLSENQAEMLDLAKDTSHDVLNLRSSMDAVLKRLEEALPSRLSTASRTDRYLFYEADVELEMKGRYPHKLGQGSFGIVYFGKLHGKHIAVKELPCESVEYQQTLQKEVARELALIGPLYHANILKMFGYVVLNNHEGIRVQILMEYLSGGNLSSRVLVPPFRLTSAEKLEICEQVVAGMVYLHSLKPAIIHRDLKCDNIMFEADGVVRIIDFGLARARDGTVYGGTKAGTLHYCAPELFKAGGQHSRASDVFAFGVVIYEMDMNLPAYEGITSAGLSDAVRTGMLLNDTKKMRDENLQVLAAGCVALDPKERKTFADLQGILLMARMLKISVSSLCATAIRARSSTCSPLVKQFEQFSDDARADSLVELEGAQVPTTVFSDERKNSDEAVTSTNTSEASSAEKMYTQEPQIEIARAEQEQELNINSTALRDSKAGASLLFPSSTIIDPSQKLQLNSWYGTPQQKWKLLYRASEHGFTAKSFHQHCDDKGPTMVIVKSSKNYIFGGYASISWASAGSWVLSPAAGSFVYTLVNPSGAIAKFDLITAKQDKALRVRNDYGPVFGYGKDMFLSDCCHRNSDSCSTLGGSYSGSGVHQFLFVGARDFQVAEYEVFGLDKAGIPKEIVELPKVPAPAPSAQIQDRSSPAETQNFVLTTDIQRPANAFDSKAEASSFFPFSTIIDASQMQQLNAWYGTPQQKWKLLYRASEHGFTAKSFHQHCDDKGPTMVIVKSTHKKSIFKRTKNYIFGGYASISWSSPYQAAAGSFVYTLVNPSGTTAKFDLRTAKDDNALVFHSSYGPVFGSGYDICIADCCHKTTSSYSDLGGSYSGFGAQPYLFVGQQHFKVGEYEVFGLTKADRSIGELLQAQVGAAIGPVLGDSDRAAAEAKNSSLGALFTPDIQLSVKARDSKAGAALLFPSSTIIGRNQMQQLNAWYGTPQQKWTLLYRASEHGFTARSFHEHCDQKGPTMVIVKSTGKRSSFKGRQNYIFGGFASISWSNGKGYSDASGSFLYTLVNPSGVVAKFNLKADQDNTGLYYSFCSGPVFGGEHPYNNDLKITDCCHQNSTSSSILGGSYHGRRAEKYLFVGEEYFQVAEYEVFALSTLSTEVN